MNSQSHNLCTTLSKHVWDKARVENECSKSSMWQLFCFFPQSLHYHLLLHCYLFLNAVITPRKTNVSPKIITYTHTTYDRALRPSPQRQIPHRPSSTIGEQKTTCPMSPTDNSSPWYNSRDIHKCPLNKQEPCVPVASSISVLKGDRQTWAYLNSMASLI